MRFCHRCGKTGKLYDGLCRDCFLLSFTLVEHEPVVRISSCRKCGSFLLSGRWKKREEIDSFLRKKLKVDERVEKAEIELSFDFERGISEFSATGEVYGLKARQEGGIKMIINPSTCDRCRKISGGYYEAIIQLRSTGRKPSREEIERSKIIAETVAGKKTAFILRCEEMKDGVDIYVSSIKGAQSIAREITNELGGKISSTSKLVGRKDGRNVYRVTLSLRLPEFGKGDIVSIDKDVILLEKIDKKFGSGINLRTGRRWRGSIHEAKKEGSIEDAKKAVVVSSDGKETQIIDPDDYKVAVAFGPAGRAKEVRVLKTGKGIFILP
jgi:nonsense-mediated mRNA decay protein 3